MTLALSPSFVLSLDLALGIHVAPATDAASPRRARSFVTPWTVSAVRTWRHTAAWTVRGAVGHRTVYGLSLARGFVGMYASLQRRNKTFALPYADCERRQRELRLPYSERAAYRVTRRAAYALTEARRAGFQAGYAITETNPHAVRQIAAWAVLDGYRLQAVNNLPELIWHDRAVRLLQATLSCDEDSPVWIGRLTLADLSDYAAIGLGETLDLHLGSERFVFIVDGKMLSRPGVGEARGELSVVSPLARYEAPFAATVRYAVTGAISAQAAVTALIGPVDWQLPDWTISAGRLTFAEVTPLTAARNLVAAIGGIIESTPAGEAVCRARHPVSVPDYGTAAVAHALFDSDVLSVVAHVAPSRGFNRVTVANEDGAASAANDRIEYVPEETDPHRGQVRAYLAPPRAVLLTHTGHPETVITDVGDVVRPESELLEFVAGTATTRYPVTRVVSAVWQHADLGAIGASGTQLQAATPGYSLLRLTYLTTARTWSVSLARDETVQFVLIDA